MWQTILSLNVPNFYQMPIFSILDHSGKVVFCTWSAVNNRDRTVNLELPFPGGNTDGNICCKANIGTVPKPLVGFFIWMVPYCSTVLKICNAMPIFSLVHANGVLMIESIPCSLGFIYSTCIKGLVIFSASHLFCRPLESVIAGLKRALRLENIKA